MQWPLASQEGLLVLILHICFVGAEWEGGTCQRLCSAAASFLNGMPALSSPLRSVLLPRPCFAGLGVEAGALGNGQGPVGLLAG